MDDLCVAKPLPLPSRDLLGGRRTRWRHCDRPRTTNRLCERCRGREFGRCWSSYLRGHGHQWARRTNPRRPTDCCSGGGSIVISHGHTIRYTACRSVDLTRGDT